MARKRSIDGDVRRLRISNFSDHDDVRRLSQHRAQCCRECHPDVGLNHHLINTRQLVLDRVLDGDDLFVRLVDDVETSV